MKKFFFYSMLMPLFIASAVFGDDGGGYGSQSYGPQSGNEPKTQEQRPGPNSNNGTDTTAKSDGAESSYRNDGPANPVKSRWQLDVGGFVGVDVERRH